MTQRFEPLDIQCDNPQAAGAYPLTPRELLLMSHRLRATGLFEDDALAELLDGYPHEDLHITTMKVDAAPGQPTSDWRAGTTQGLGGEQILRAVRSGHLWLNVKRLDRNAPLYAQLLDTLYRELSATLGCTPPSWRSATLLISSPGASVYYHLDSIPNILWHIRGRKTVFLYPNDDERFAPTEFIERICSGESDEELPYRPDFESAARVIELEPGRALMWPQNSPHRVANSDGLNVSLSTEHLTPRARRRVYLHRGNRLLRRAGITPGGVDARGGNVKMALAACDSVLRKLRRQKPIRFELTPTFRVDPEAHNGYRDIGSADE
jgi:hypothetical protein